MSATGDRGFTDRDVAAVIKRALQLQKAASPAGDRGLPLEELEQIGQDAGIPAELIRRAARELDERRRVAGPARLLGGTPVPVEEASVPWAGGPRELGALSDVIEAAAGFAGTGRIVGGELRWRSANVVRVSVRP
jgi:hypothetical protein